MCSSGTPGWRGDEGGRECGHAEFSADFFGQKRLRRVMVVSDYDYSMGIRKLNEIRWEMIEIR